MQASDFDEALTGTNPGLRRMLSLYFRGSRTTSGWSEGSLSLQRRVMHLCMQQGHCSGARVEGSCCRRGGECCTCRCFVRMRMHAHIHSLCQRTQNVQVTCLAGARSFAVCAHAFTDHSLSLGRGGVAGSKLGKQDDEDTDLAMVL